MAAAAISSAMKPDSTVEKVISDCLDAAKFHKTRMEGVLWPGNELYQYVGLKNEKLIEKGIEIAKKYNDAYKMRDELLGAVVQDFGPDASETLAIAMTMFYAAKGDYVESVKGAVNCGRDNDSSASVAGAVSGAFCGLDKIPAEWIKLVEGVNEKPTFKEIAESICRILIERYNNDKKVLGDFEGLIDK